MLYVRAGFLDRLFDDEGVLDFGGGAAVLGEPSLQSALLALCRATYQIFRPDPPSGAVRR